MNELIIKNAQKSDTNIILEFIKKLANYEKLSLEVTATVEDIEKSLFSKDSNVNAIIGYIDDQPVTFAIFFHNFSTFLGKKGLYLEDLFVLPEFRNKGIGKKMLKHLAEIAVERNCGRFEWSVLDWNEPAIEFYKSIGAELKHEWIIARVSGEKLLNLAE